MKITDTTQNLIERFGTLYKSELEAASKLQYLTTSRGGKTMARAAAIQHVSSSMQERSLSILNTLRPYKSTFIHDGHEMIALETQVLPAYEIEDLALSKPYYGIVAWMNEAIQAKKDLLERIKNAGYYAFVTKDDERVKYLEQFEYPEMEGYEEYEREMYDIEDSEPVEQEVPDDNSIFILLFSSAKRSQYLIDDAEAKRIGALIHKNGPLYALHNLSYVIKSIVDSQQVGDKAYPVQNTLMYDQAEIEELQAMYTTMQAHHLKLQESVNYYRKAVEDEKARLEAELKREYTQRYQEWMKKRDDLQQEWDQFRRSYDLERLSASKTYSSNRVALISDINARRAELRSEAASLRIFVPETLRELVSEVEVEVTLPEE